MDLVGEYPVYCSATVIDAMFLNKYAGCTVPNIFIGRRGVLSFFGKVLGGEGLVIYTWFCLIDSFGLPFAFN